MTRDPLERLRAIRAGHTDAARRSLADVVTAIVQAEAAVHEATGRLQTERDAALDGNAGDGAVEAYMRWLPTGRSALERAAARQTTLIKESDLARAALGLARASERAVEVALDHRRTETRRRLDRSEQADLDEASYPRSRPVGLTEPDA